MLGNYEDKTTPSNISLGNKIIAIAAMNMLETGDHSLRRYLMPSETELAHICGVTPETAQGSLHLLWANRFSISCGQVHYPFEMGCFRLKNRLQ